jgi:hypothetical protein
MIQRIVPIALLFLSVSVYSQSPAIGVGVNTDGSSPDASSILDVKSTDKGILIPRMTAAQRGAIASPATGLMVYQTDATAGFYYYSGTAWVQAIGPAGATGATGPAGATGATGPAGAAGADGKTVLNGTSNPASGTGNDGDFYINTSTNTLFGPKASGSWPSGISLVGPQGATGAAGATGATGATGAAGATGATGPAGPAPSGTGLVAVSGGTLQTPGALTGDVTTSGAGLATTIANGAVTSAKILDATIANADIANSTIDLTTKVTGILPVANGGTGASSLTANSLLAGSGTNAVSLIAPGTAGNVLVSNGTSWTSGSTNNFIQNQTAADQTAGFRITGNGLVGGNVGIGTASPLDRLDVRSAMSVNEIKFRNLDGGDDTDPYRLRKFQSSSNINELQLHLNDDPFERFAVYGNSCASSSGCVEYSTLLYHYFRADGYAYHAGWLGIGTTSPAAPLHVASYTNQTISYGWLNSGGNVGSASNQTVPISIQADARIRAGEFNAVSDARIKTDINTLNTGALLADLNKLNVVNYSYIDKVVNGTKAKTGFIAQQVESVNPGFVNQSPDFIPSVFAMAASASFEQDVLHVTSQKPHGFEKGNLVKFFAGGKKEIILTIEDVKSPDIFSVKGWTEGTQDLFIYGKKVDDFRAVDFDQITALSVAAIQELTKQVDCLKMENEYLKKNMISTDDFESMKAEINLLKESLLRAENK